MTNIRPRFGIHWIAKKISRVSTVIAALICGVACADDAVQGGKSLFQREWTHHTPQDEDAGDGLGPMFNATSCEQCHAKGGGAGVDRNVTLLTLDPRSTVLNPRKIPIPQARVELLDLYPGLLNKEGVLSMDIVLHEQSARPFFDSIRKSVVGHIPDNPPVEWIDSRKRTIDAIANRPVLAGRVGAIDFYLSQRNSPALFGLGLIDKIQPSQLAVMASRQDSHTSGKVTGRVGVGKLGWRAQTETLEKFVRGACAGELGLQVADSPQPDDVADATYVSKGVDLQEQEVAMLVSYVRSLPPPIQEIRSAADPKTIREGRRLFSKIGCVVCHVENVPPAKGVYSDFLLHDMGSLLQAPSPSPPGPLLVNLPRQRIPTFAENLDPFGRSPGQSPGKRFRGYSGFSGGDTAPRPYALNAPVEPKFPRGKIPEEKFETRNPSEMTWDLLQREWRTPPLWGVADSGPYLHDGRAATLDAAIRWHDGEANDSATQYRSLKSQHRDRVLAFLGSLRSPPETRRETLTQRPAPLMTDALVSDADEVFQDTYRARSPRETP